jgi:hypothetical protein
MAASPTYNISAPAVIASSATTLDTVIPQGTAAITLNDCATVGAATVANQIFSGTLYDDEVKTFSWPCGTGLVVSKITGTVAVAAG